MLGNDIQEEAQAGAKYSPLYIYTNEQKVWYVTAQ